jgi:hypothetical protein
MSMEHSIMQLTNDGMYKCVACGVKHTNPLMAAACEKTHHILYMPVYKDLYSSYLQEIVSYFLKD